MNSITGFELLETKHTSASSIVYKALRLRDKKSVILKSINPDNYNAEFIGKLKHEYDISCLVSGMEVIKILDIIQESNQCSLVIEDIEAQPLSELIAQDNLNDLSEILQVAIKIIEGLSNIHQARVIHKDINPSNIILNRKTGQVKIIDFGISSQLSKENTPLTSPTSVEGTLPYVAPEQSGRMNRSVDYRSDFYSLGVTLFEVLTHHTPFESSDPIEVIHGHIAKTAPRVTDLNPSIPQVLSDIVAKLLSKSAEDRYQGCWGIKSDLEKCLDQINQFNTISPFPLALHDVPDRFHVPQKLYGRLNEVECILSSFERVAQGAREGIFIGGHSGIGKTALVREIYKPLTKQKGYFISGKFDQYQKQKPYSAVHIAFTQLIKQLLSEGDKQLGRWKARLIDTVGGSINVITDVIPELELIVGPQPPLDPLPPMEAQNRFKISFGRFLEVFCKKEHPLAIFLDDLQWADVASLSILNLLLHNTSIKYLLFIGAYRDNEVSESSALQPILNYPSNETINIQKIHLLPLNLQDITQQLADALYLTPKKVETLAQLITNKTAGNPFFIEEFLKSLYNDKLIQFDREQGAWTWSIDNIEDANFSDNVVEFLTQRIRLLPEETQRMLATAACIGNRFDIATLSKFHSESLSSTALKLRDASIEGFIIPSNLSLQISELSDSEISEILHKSVKIEYRFSHDRIQQSAYTFLDRRSKNAIHEQLGWYFYNEDKRPLEARIFDIVDNLNIYFSPSREHDSLVAELNYLAAQKSKNSTAYSAAQNYIETARALTPGEWTNDSYQQKLKITTESVEIDYLNNNLEHMQELSEIVINKARNIVDSLQVRMIQIQALNSQNKPHESIGLGLSTLKLVGIKVSKTPSKIQIIKELLLLRLALRSLDDEALYTLPEMTEPSFLYAQKIISIISLPSYLINKNLSILLGLKAMRLAIRHGNSDSSAMSYMIYAIILCGVLEDFDAGQRFGQLSIRLAEKYKAKTIIPRTLYTYDLTIRPWKEPIAQGIKSTTEAYNLALESGALETAATCTLTAIMCKIYAGYNLQEIANELSASSKISHELNQALVFSRIALNQQHIDNLIHRNDYASILSGKFADEHTKILEFKEANDQVSLSTLYSYKLITCFVYRESENLFHICSKNEHYLSASISQPKVSAFYFLCSLSLLYLYPSMERARQKETLKKVKRYKSKLNKYRTYCPESNAHRYHLVEAELYKTNGQNQRAITLYDKAIRFATESQNLGEKAICEECAGRFYIDIGSQCAGEAYLRPAKNSFQKWGALGKVNALNSEFNLSNSPYNPTAQHTTAQHTTSQTPIIENKSFNNTTSQSTIASNSFGNDQFDSASLIKTYRALSSEMNTNNLINKLTQYLMENAGAQNAYLLILEENRWMIRSHNSVQNDSDFKPTLLSSQSPISTRVIHYVERSAEALILDNAEVNPNFGMDPHISNNRIKSILCLPIKYKSKFTTIFYAEHRDMKNAFSTEQIRVLDVIASQGAIALENAALYSTLKGSEDQYRGLFENSVEGLFQANIDGSLIIANPAFISMLGYSSLSEMQKNIINIFSNQHAKENNFQQLKAAIKEHGKVVNTEGTIVRFDKSEIDILYSINLVLDEDGNPLRMDGCIKDVTAQKRSAELFLEKERAEAASDAKSQFLANMSHEIRTPMNGVLGIADLLKNTKLDPMQSHYVQVIADSGKSLLEIINDILDFSKIESGKMEIENIEIEIEELLDEVVSLFSIRSSESKVALVVDVANDVPKIILGDPTRIRQILMNLVGNAFKFTETGSIRVNLETTSANSSFELKFSIQDTGIGIPESAKNKLFQSYEQVDNSTTRKYGGTGLGLSICKHLAELMEGEIGIDSSAGEGSTFWFTIPAQPASNNGNPSINQHILVDPKHKLTESELSTYLYTDNDCLKDLLLQIPTGHTEKTRCFQNIENLSNEFEATEKPETQKYIIFLHSLNEPEVLFEQFKSLAEFYSNLEHIKIVYLSEPNFPVNETFLAEEPFKNAFIAERPLSTRGFLRIYSTLLASSTSETDVTKFERPNNLFLQGRKVLIAEDNKVNQLVIQRQVDAFGADITIVDNGLLALKNYEENLCSNDPPYEIILMDCEMPEMDGFKSTGLIREAEKRLGCPPVKIIALTAHALAENEKKCLACGMDAVLTKPVVRKDLENTLQKAISPIVH